MTPIASKLFMSEIMPRILATVPRRVHPVGAEDIEEISQDTLAIAAAMLDSAEAHGKPILPGSIAWFAIQSARKRVSPFFLLLPFRLGPVNAVKPVEGVCQ